MSRISGAPVVIPDGVDVDVDGQSVTVKGGKGELTLAAHPTVVVSREDGVLKFSTQEGAVNAVAFAGTTRALVNNMVTGVSAGFEKKLELVGVGYRAQMKDKVLNLSLGYSHPIDFEIPEGVAIETPTQTQIVVSGVDKQQVGQVAAVIRGFRPPEPYKGKGVRYAGEQIVRKVAKKK
jgi:large subunit ribosomal protein L6